MARKQGCHCRQCKQCVLHFSNNLTQIKMCRKTMRAGKGAERQRRRGQEGAPCLARILGTQAMPSAGPSPGHMSRIFQRQLRLLACLPACLLLPCVKYLSLLTRYPSRPASVFASALLCYFFRILFAVFSAAAFPFPARTGAAHLHEPRGTGAGGGACSIFICLLCSFQ